MSEQDSEDPGRAFLLYLHAAVTQVTASAMRTRVERERRDRDRQQARRNQAYDASRAKRDAQAEADAARRATEHQARMELHKERLAETRERVHRMQESRNFAAKAGATREFQHTFDDLIGAFAAAAATRDRSPQHEELARLLAERLREQTGLDPDQVMADARQRMEKGPGWVDAGHVVTAEMADVLVEMQMDEDTTEEVAAGGTAEGAAITEQISRARVGEPPLGQEPDPGFVASERADDPVAAAQSRRQNRTPGDATVSSTRGVDQFVDASVQGSVAPDPGVLQGDLEALWAQRLLRRINVDPVGAVAEVRFGTPGDAELDRDDVVTAEWVEEPVQTPAGPTAGTDRTTHAQAGANFWQAERLDQTEPDAEVVTGEVVEGGGVIAEHIDRARVGQLALVAGSPGDSVAAEAIDEQMLAAQLDVASGVDSQRGAGL